MEKNDMHLTKILVFILKKLPKEGQDNFKDIASLLSLV